MPYKTDKAKIDCPFFDKRVKLLPCQKEMVLYYHQQGFSQRKLAKMFNVSRRLIIFTIHPERLAKNLEARRDRGGTMAYYKGGETWNAYQRKHRKHKYNLLKETL
jgi:hypothetical protein